MSRSTAIDGRAWMVTVWPKSIKNLGLGDMLTDDLKPKDGTGKEIVEAVREEWICSGKGRTCGAVACISASEGFHLHMGVYCASKVKWSTVVNVLGKSHVEEQRSTKAQLTKYLLKQGEFEEKGEVVLYASGLDDLQDGQGSRNDLAVIEDMLNKGFNPRQIMEVKLSYRRYEKMIRAAFFDKRREATPFIRDVKVYWHVGLSGSGKTYTAQLLMEQYGKDEVFIVTDYDSGGFDNYCAQRVLFMEEYRGQFRFSTFLNLIDKYLYEFHARYTNIVGLWTEVHITSVLPPEQVYNKMVQDGRQDDPIDQMKRRITSIVYHYKQGDKYKTYEMPMTEYVDLNDLREKATGEEFIEATEEDMEVFGQMELDL